MRSSKNLRYGAAALLLLSACRDGSVSVTGADQGTSESGTASASQTSTGAEPSNVGGETILFCGEAVPVVLSSCGNSQSEPGEFCVTSTAIELPEPQQAGYSLAIADFDLDDATDVVVNGYFYRGGSQGLVLSDEYNFFGVDGRARSVTVGDVNADGNPDLVHMEESEDPVVAILAHQDFPDERTLIASFSGSDEARNHRIAVADVNMDELPDIVVTYEGFHTELIAFRIATQRSGTGVGTFENLVPAVDVAIARLFEPNVPLLGVRDIDVDDDPDIVARNVLLRNDGTGSFSMEDLRMSHVPELEFVCESVPVGLELESTNSGDLPTVGYVRETSEFGLAINADHYYWVLGAAPINNDSAYDLILGNLFGAYIAFALGDGLFDDAIQLSSTPAHRVGFGNLNSDERLDFVLLNETHLEIFIAEQ